MRQDPISQIQHATFAVVFARNAYVVANGHVDAVVVDWIQDFPMKRLLLRNNIMIRLLQAAVGDSHQIVRHGYTDLHPTIRLVGAVIFVGPPNACPDSLAGGNDEWLSEIIAAP